MNNRACRVVPDCQSCPGQRNRNHHRKQLSLFPAAGTLAFMPMDMLGPLLKTRSGNQHVSVFTDRYSKHKRSIPDCSAAWRALLPYLSTMESSATEYRQIYWPTTDRGFYQCFFVMDIICLGIQRLKTPACSSKANGQINQFHRTIVGLIQHCMAGPWTAWMQHGQSLTYAYNIEGRRLNRTMSFSLVLFRHPAEAKKSNLETMGLFWMTRHSHCNCCLFIVDLFASWTSSGRKLRAESRLLRLATNATLIEMSHISCSFVLDNPYSLTDHQRNNWFNPFCKQSISDIDVENRRLFQNYIHNV